MSFTFNWPRFSDQFHYDAIQMLNNALNKGNKPPVIADKIEVVELQMGTEPPELEIREIGELTVDQFRGIFRLSYSGDARLVLKTKVQANPLNHKQPDIHLMAGTKGMLAARQPLVVPMLLRLSQFKLRSIVVLVVSKQKGITLVFKTDPLQNVDISSTFDSIAVIQKFIQREIEGQLRQMFREDLPGIIHRLSQQWVKAKVEAPYLSKQPAPPPTAYSSPPAPLSHRNVAGIPSVQPPFPHNLTSESGSLRRPRSPYSGMSASTSRRTAVTAGPSRSRPSSPPNVSANDISNHTFPELENYDPTYGLRPEGLPTKSVFKGFRNLFSPNRGLADLAEEVSELDDEAGLYDYDDSSTFDMVDWDDGLSLFAQRSERDSESPKDPVEYERIPAVGGGTITRPRIVHSQSMMGTPDSPSPLLKSNNRLSRSFDNLASPLYAGNVMSPTLGGLHSGFNPYFPEASPVVGTRSPLGLHGTATPLGLHGKASPLGLSGIPSTMSVQATSPLNAKTRRSITPDSLETQRTTSEVKTPQEGEAIPLSIPRHPRSRRPSVSSAGGDNTNIFGTSPSNHVLYDLDDTSPRIILRPSAHNNSLHHLSTLSHSNHTLSPYTRSLEHFTVRSGPPRYGGGPSGTSNPADRQPAKAKRKRTYRLGSQKAQPASDSVNPDSPLNTPRSSSHLPTDPPSEFDIDVADMDRYFRAAHDVNDPQPNHSGPGIRPNHFRLRSSYVHPE
ncbi:hypothetical protein K435DRAFT_707862 [Dendrothele bispora CBS 962.96]|uniref:Mitochondrial distribution and morphology protein 34 n=1 Tax=Dendrothele bispora (strain CBS 962.96) TaxID=1314807 RepID=A0A4S8MZM8_DENBC|nr:hypothetical protein K435DRAFT_707862 [Dendrothele bispora CBS 962.96]